MTDFALGVAACCFFAVLIGVGLYRHFWPRKPKPQPPATPTALKQNGEELSNDYQPGPR